METKLVIFHIPKNYIYLIIFLSKFIFFVAFLIKLKTRKKSSGWREFRKMLEKKEEILKELVISHLKSRISNSEC